MSIPIGMVDLFTRYHSRVRVFMKQSNIRFDVTIPEDTIFGPEKDRYCRKMFETALLRGADINPYHMWKKVTHHSVICKYCRLPGDSEVIQHDCGWWEDVRAIHGRICFCFCHDALGYALTDGDHFVICKWRMMEIMLDDYCTDGRAILQDANELRIDYIHGVPPKYIKYVASRNGREVFSDDDTGPLHPSQVLSIQAFQKFRRHYNIYMERLRVYRITALGQFVTMQSKRYFQRCSKALWLLREDTEVAMIRTLKKEGVRDIARLPEHVQVETKTRRTQD